MIAKGFIRLLTAVVVLILIGFTGCERNLDSLDLAKNPTDAEVFLDGFGPGLEYQAFGGSKLDALAIDEDTKFQGIQSMRFTVPNVGDPTGAYAGGAFVSSGRDLTDYNVLTFYAKASTAAIMGSIGFGNDNSGNSLYVTEITDVSVSTSWKKYFVPIPDADKLEMETGMFQVSIGAPISTGIGFDVWFDEVKYEELGTIAQIRPDIGTQTINIEVGDSVNVTGPVVTSNVDGIDQTVNAAPAYFSYESSNDAVATVDDKGKIKAVALGSAEITGSLNALAAAGTITINVAEASPEPQTAAPDPAFDAGDVISLFSNEYSNEMVDTWRADWEFSTSEVNDIQVAGDDVKLYTNVNFAGIEFTSSTIDASEMTHFYFNIWTPDITPDLTAVRIKLVDFGANGQYSGPGSDDSEGELTFDGTSTPALTNGTWLTYDIPLSSFTGLTAQAHLAQLILAADPDTFGNTLYIDNVLFHK